MGPVIILHLICNFLTFYTLLHIKVHNLLVVQILENYLMVFF